MLGGQVGHLQCQVGEPGGWGEGKVPLDQRHTVANRKQGETNEGAAGNLVRASARRTSGRYPDVASVPNHPVRSSRFHSGIQWLRQQPVWNAGKQRERDNEVGANRGKSRPSWSRFVITGSLDAKNLREHAAFRPTRSLDSTVIIAEDQNRMGYRQIVTGITLACIIGAMGVGATHLLGARRLRMELGKANEEMQAGLYSLARKRLTRLAAERPREAGVTFHLGRCEAARGKTDEAIKLWAHIPADSPWAAPAAIEWAQAALPRGRIIETERVLRAAMRRSSPELAGLVHDLLMVLGQQGRIDAARRFVESLWRDTAVLPARDVANRLGILREYMALELEPFPHDLDPNMLERFLSRLETASATAGYDDQRTLALARAHLAALTRDFERARAELKACLDRRPSDPEVWNPWLNWAVAAGRPELAREALHHVPASLLEQAEIENLRVWFARERRDAVAERDALEGLIAIDPGRTSALARLAELLQQAGETEAATKLRRRKSEFPMPHGTIISSFIRRRQVLRASSRAGTACGTTRSSFRGPRVLGNCQRSAAFAPGRKGRAGPAPRHQHEFFQRLPQHRAGPGSRPRARFGSSSGRAGGEGNRPRTDSTVRRSRLRRGAGRLCPG